MSEDIMEKINNTLEEIKSLILLLNQDKLRAVKDQLLKSGTVKEKIYNMCDETKTVEEMAKSLGKGTGYVHSNLSRLRREGLIQNSTKNNRQVYRQIF